MQCQGFRVVHSDIRAKTSLDFDICGASGSTEYDAGYLGSGAGGVVADVERYDRMD
jgi:hypothetical protein